LILIIISGVFGAFPECPEAPEIPKDRRINKNKLTVASFNAEWLFLQSEGKKDCPGSGCPWSNETIAIQHLNRIADVISDIDADIVNIVEVQNCNVLKKLNERLVGQKYLPYLVQGTDSATGQNVGILTRIDPVVDLQRTANRVEYPIPNTKCTSKITGDTGVSKHFYTTFHVEGMTKPLSLIGLHFLAFPDDLARCVQREAQATVIQQLSKQFSSNHLIILGDMNDFDPSVEDASDSITITGVLDILKESRMINVASEVEQISSRYSCWYDKNNNCKVDKHELTILDHLLLSKDLSDSIEDAYYYHGYSAYCGTLNSDHWPVVVTLDLVK